MKTLRLYNSNNFESISECETTVFPKIIKSFEKILYNKETCGQTISFPFEQF